MILFQKPLNIFNYDTVDLPLIQQFNAHNPHVWSRPLTGLGLPPRASTRRDEIKDYMKERLYTIQGKYCIYCGNKFRSNNSAHREHIIPKVDYPEYTFHPKNLVLSCDVCNGFELKGEIDFTLNEAATRANYDNLDLEIIHPYLDDIFEHLDVKHTTIRLINNSAKGKKHIEVFKLNEGWNHEQRLRVAKSNKYSIPLPFQNLFHSIVDRYHKYKSK